MLKSKTVITAIGAALGACGAALEGSLEWSAAIQVIVTAALSIFLRHGISKSQDAAEAAAEAASTVVPVKKAAAKKKTG